MEVFSECISLHLQARLWPLTGPRRVAAWIGPSHLSCTSTSHSCYPEEWTYPEKSERGIYLTSTTSASNASKPSTRKARALPKRASRYEVKLVRGSPWSATPRPLKNLTSGNAPDWSLPQQNDPVDMTRTTSAIAQVELTSRRVTTHLRTSPSTRLWICRKLDTSGPTRSPEDLLRFLPWLSRRADGEPTSPSVFEYDR